MLVEDERDINCQNDAGDTPLQVGMSVVSSVAACAGPLSYSGR